MAFWNILAVDTSASMLSNLDSMKKGIIDLFKEQEKNKDRFTFITFNSVVNEIIDLNFNEVNYDDIIKNLNIKGMTALYDSIGYVYEKILYDQYKNITITLITDGYENSSVKYNLHSLKDLRKEVDKVANINMTFICSDNDILNSNSAIISHANESCEISGDYVKAFRTVSRTLSSFPKNPSEVSNVEYSVENENENENEISITEPIIKRQNSYYHNEKKRPRLFF